MYHYIFRWIFVVCALSIVSCVENPNVTEEVYLKNPNAAKSWVVGLQRQLSVTVNTVAINVEITSDNYFNNYSQYSKVFDQLQIDYFDPDVNNLQADVQELREMARYGIETVLPADGSATPEDEAFMYFCLGYANVLGGELFTGLPASNKGEVQTPETLFQNALDALHMANSIDSSPERVAVNSLLMARIYYNLGDPNQAMEMAQEALAIADLLYQVKFDGQNGVGNQMQTATFDALPNRLAPLPRLDFLDPKYYSTGTPETDQKPVAIVKAEEAHLIIAEAYLAKNNSNAAKIQLNSLLDLVGQRPVVQVDDSGETRNGGNREDYPLEAVNVKFEPANSFQGGYVLDRQQGNISVYTVSGTKVTPADIEAADNIEDLLYLVYRLRQEIFFSEGRRVSDLGIKYPISQIEQDNNPNISEEYTQAVIPDYLSGIKLDDFTVGANGDITIAKDLNKIIVNNRTSSFTVPFF